MHFFSLELEFLFTVHGLFIELYWGGGWGHKRSPKLWTLTQSLQTLTCIVTLSIVDSFSFVLAFSHNVGRIAQKKLVVKEGISCADFPPAVQSSTRLWAALDGAVYFFPLLDGRGGTSFCCASEVKFPPKKVEVNGCQYTKETVIAMKPSIRNSPILIDSAEDSQSGAQIDGARLWVGGKNRHWGSMGPPCFWVQHTNEPPYETFNPWNIDWLPTKWSSAGRQLRCLCLGRLQQNQSTTLKT